MDKKKYILAIQIIMEAYDLTYANIAHATGINRSTLCSFMTKKHKPHDENMLRIRKYVEENIENAKRKIKYRPVRISIRLRYDVDKENGLDIKISKAADDIGINSSRLTDIMDGNIEPTREELCAIERWMGYTVKSVNELKAECMKAELDDVMNGG